MRSAMPIVDAGTAKVAVRSGLGVEVRRSVEKESW